MPITPADEQRLQAVFEWAKRLFRRKGLTEHNAEDCAAEVRLQMLAHLQQGRTFSFAYAVQVARGVLADFVAAQQRQPPTVPMEHADWHGGGSRLWSSGRLSAGRWSNCPLTPARWCGCTMWRATPQRS